MEFKHMLGSQPASPEDTEAQETELGLGLLIPVSETESPVTVTPFTPTGKQQPTHSIWG